MPSLLGPQGEQKLGRDLRAARLGLWTALLSWSTTRKTILSWTRELFGEPLMRRRSPASLHEIDHGDVAHELALRVLDPHNARRGRSWRRYVERVQKAHELVTRLRNRFVTANVGLVYTLAYRFEHYFGLTFDDLVQEGCLGLMKAVDRFDPDRGVRFSTFGAWWIRAEIGRAIVEQGRLIRLPGYLVFNLVKIRKAYFSACEKGVDPSPENLAKIAGVPIAHVHRLLESPVRAAPEPELIEEADPEERVLSIEATERVRTAVAALNDRDREILYHRYAFNGHKLMTLQEIGKANEISRERARQLQKRAIRYVQEQLADLR